MTTATKKKDASVTTPEDSVAAEQAADVQTHEASGKGPVWKTQSNRVQAAVWSHHQTAKDGTGKSRHTISISRSYRDGNGSWQNVHFFDLADLADVKKVADEAYAYIAAVTKQG